MRKLPVIGFVLVVVLFFACTKKTPEEVVKRYYTHFFKGEYDKLQDFVVEEQREGFALMNELIPPKEREKSAREKVEVSNVKCKILSDTVAICSCLLKVGKKEAKNENIRLRKVGKSWLVD